MAPKVTVVLTVFRRNKYLREALVSLENQVFKNFEVLVTDDANQTETKLICESFTGMLNIRYRSNPEPFGTFGNVCAALRESRGQYVAILNDDDLFAPLMLELSVQHLEENPDVALSFSNYIIIDTGGAVLDVATNSNMRLRGRDGLKSGRISNGFDFVLRRNVMAVIGCLFRKEIFDYCWLRTEVAGAYDYWIALNIAQIGPLYFDDSPLMSWRQHSESVSSRVSGSVFSGEVFIYEQAGDWNLTPSQTGYVQAQLAHFLLLRGKELLAHDFNNQVVRGALIKSLAVKPRIMTVLVLMFSICPRVLRRAFLVIWHRSLQLRLSLGLTIFSPG